MTDLSQKYRSKGRIYADILKALQENGQSKITHILYRSNLSHVRLGKYLAQLEQSNLIVRHEEGEKTTYSITKSGEEFLMEFRRMENFAIAFGLDI
jgi:predicted transcriptional regulator